MGDRVYAAIRIGGHLETIEDAETLAELIDGERSQSGGGRISGLAGAQSALREAVEGRTTVDIDDDEVNYGEFSTIEPVIRGMPKLWCSTTFEAGGGFAAGIKTIYHDGKGAVQEASCSTSDGEAVIPLSRLVSAAKEEDRILGAVVRSLITEIEKSAGTSLPPLTASPAVMAWLKIFGEKAA